MALGAAPAARAVAFVLMTLVSPELPSFDLALAHLSLEKRISGYCYHKMQGVLLALLFHGDSPQKALETIWDAGGDTDTTGAILGGILGSWYGPDAFAAEWVGGIRNYPISVDRLRSVAGALTCREGAIQWSWPLVPIRNLSLLIIVLLHGFRRLIPI